MESEDGYWMTVLGTTKLQSYKSHFSSSIVPVVERLTMQDGLLMLAQGVVVHRSEIYQMIRKRKESSRSNLLGTRFQGLSPELLEELARKHIRDAI